MPLAELHQQLHNCPFPGTSDRLIRAVQPIKRGNDKNTPSATGAVTVVAVPFGLAVRSTVKLTPVG